MIVEIKNIRKKYGRKEVLTDISFTASSCECVGILGANGCGKSTFLSIIAGIQKPDSGEMLIDGNNILKYPKIRERCVGYVPQGTPLVDELTAKDNLSLWYDRKTLNRELDGGVLKMLGIDEFLKVPVKKMSGGMKKRLSIGCAVAKRPPILLLDEPGAALDLVCREAICKYLTDYKAGGGLILLTTHDAEELKLCDRYFIIKNGVALPYDYDGNIERLVNSF